MKRCVPVLFVLLIMLLAGMFPGVVLGNGPLLEETPSYSNRDLEKYQTPSGLVASVPADKPEKQERPAQDTDRKEKNYWCSKASEYRKKIDRAKDGVRDIEKSATDEGGGQAFDESTLKKPARRKYERAKKALRDAQREMSYLEEDAHRKDIPPGWLRCQFE